MKLFAPIIDLLYPPVCLGCKGSLSDADLKICVNCRHNLPVTNFHFDNSDAIQKLFYGRLQLENATALFRFHKKGIVQQLMHNLKYKGHEDLGLMLGNWLGNELKSLKAYQNIDVVIPVPLHKKKLKKRGYNQVEQFGKALANSLNAKYEDAILIKITATKTQVFKNRASRWQQNEQVFTVINDHKLKDKHILLVDDIITTGATLEACAEILTKTHNNTLSIATMAIA